MKNQTWHEQFGSLDRPVTIKDLLLIAEVILAAIEQAKDKIMQNIDDLVAAVNDESTEIDSLTTLLNGVEQQLKDALAGITVPAPVAAKIQQVFDKVRANTQKLADAIVANTPSDPSSGGTDTNTDTSGGDGSDSSAPTS
jgi:hypothetical protein